MKDVPSKISETFLRAKHELQVPIVLRKINGHYYIYSATSKWDREKRKIVSIQHYVGRIRDDGTFVKKMDYAELERIKAAPQKYETQPTEINETDKKILTTLSMNGRVTLSLLSKLTDLSSTSLHHRIKHLERIYGIRYTIELNLDKLGYLKFLVFARFLNKKPTAEEIKKATENIPEVQFVATVTGKYDILIYLLAKDNQDVSNIVNKIRDSEFSDYFVEWYISNFYETYSFIPLRNIFIDSIKEKLKEREFHLLKELNLNGSEEFTAIDKKYGLERGRANYAYGGLKENGILKRTTITMSKAPIKYVGIIYMYIIEAGKFIKNREKLLIDIIKETNSQVNNYLLVGDIGVPKGVIFFAPVLKDGDMEYKKESLEHLKLGIKVEISVITNNIIGAFCYRKFDNAYSRQNEILEKTYSKIETTRLKYDETGRPKRVTSKKIDIRGVDISSPHDEKLDGDDV